MKIVCTLFFSFSPSLAAVHLVSPKPKTTTGKVSKTMAFKSSLLLLAAVSASGERRAMPTMFPSGHVWGCYNISAGFPFCDSSLPMHSRINDLVSRLTDAEKVRMMAPDTTHHVGSCSFMDGGLPRFGVPAYLHLVEMNTAVASMCLAEDQCATQFPGPTGLGAAFNTTMWRIKGETLSDEFRALNNIRQPRGTDDHKSALIGLTGYGPNINIMRDPRWGRNSEVPSEDPFLAGEYAHHYVRGGQAGSDSRYTKVAMSLKHFTAYSVEANREGFAPEISKHDLWETFLPQYERGMNVNGGNATGVMCSYASPNGVPACANNYLLNDVLRDSFHRPDAVVGTDCGAVDHMVHNNKYAKTEIDAASDTLFGGTDLELGDQYWSPKELGGKGLLEQLLSQNRSTVQPAVDLALSRILAVRFKTGQFDDLADQPYTKIGKEVVNSTAHSKVNLDSAIQSMVLLKNNNSVLPLSMENTKKPIKLALLGPHTVSRGGLFSDYHGDQTCFDNTFNCVETVEEKFTELIGKEQGGYVSSLVVEEGVDISSTDTSRMAAALQAGYESDVVIYFCGLNHSVEHEGIDRTNVTLPGLQGELLDKILMLSNKPRVIVVLVNGGAVSLGKNVLAKSDAIVDAFYPAYRGAEAMYINLFGKSNSWGRLPYTQMKAETVYRLDMNSFNMSLAPGRTYKYLTEEPEFAFGHGLSYTTFSVSECTANNVVVKNTGARAGDAVVMLFHRPGDDVRAAVGGKHPVPLKTLIGFDKVALAPGASQLLTLTGQRYESLDESLKLVNADGVRTLYPGTHYLDFFDGVNTCTFTHKI